ncbi:hypothetical protein Tco_0016003 [Tanacetum coccineum]
MVTNGPSVLSMLTLGIRTCQSPSKQNTRLLSEHILASYLPRSKQFCLVKKRLINRKKGRMLDKIWEYCKDVHINSTYWWHDHEFEEEERDEMGIEIEKYDPPEVKVETFKVRFQQLEATFETDSTRNCVVALPI